MCALSSHTSMLCGIHAIAAPRLHIPATLMCSPQRRTRPATSHPDNFVTCHKPHKVPLIELFLIAIPFIFSAPRFLPQQIHQNTHTKKLYKIIFSSQRDFQFQSLFRVSSSRPPFVYFKHLDSLRCDRLTPTLHGSSSPLPAQQRSVFSQDYRGIHFTFSESYLPIFSTQ